MARKKARPQPFVLDSSVPLAWCFHDETSACADDIARRFPSIEPIVPQLWHLEIANAFLVAERRGRSTQGDTATWTAYLASLPIATDDQTAAVAWGETLRLARAHNLSAYDGAYLELAIRRSLPLATLDDRMRAAASAAGIQLFGTT